MTTSLYDFSVASFLQTLGAVEGFLDKGRTFCESNDIDLNTIVETRLYKDMLPFRFQIASVAHHSLGAIKGVEAGLFTPPGGADDLDFGGLQALVADARSGLQSYSREAVDQLAGRDVTFKLGEHSIEFTAEGFLASFSLPNFYFHATTAYDILREQGAPIGKRDFLGRMRMKRA